jgi:hypothetical protein
MSSPTCSGIFLYIEKAQNCQSGGEIAEKMSFSPPEREFSTNGYRKILLFGNN